MIVVGGAYTVKKLLGSLAVATMAAGTAFAADMPLKAPPMEAPAPSWTGFYFGANVGAVWTSNTGTWTPLPTPAQFGVLAQGNATGGTSISGGVQGGFNWQVFPSWVVGVEGDISWTGASGSFSNPWITTAGGPVLNSMTIMRTNLDSVSSARGRLGYLIMPNLLVYGTGGVAWGKIDYEASSGIGSGAAGAYFASTGFSNTATGVVAGGGLEYMLTDHWLVRGEWLHYRFNNSQSVTVTPANFPALPSGFAWSSTNVDSVRVALSYKF
jgi:outer membrane immunogenic protein